MSPVIEEQPNHAKTIGKAVLIKASLAIVMAFVGLWLFIYFDGLGSSAFYSGQPEKALEPTKRALWVQELVLGSDALEVANTRKNLARVYDALKRCDEAEPLYTASLKTYNAKNAQNTEAYAETLSYLSDHQRQIGKFDDSLSNCKAAEAIMQKLNKSGTREYAWMLQREALSLKGLNRREEAQAVDDQAKKILGKV